MTALLAVIAVVLALVALLVIAAILRAPDLDCGLDCPSGRDWWTGKPR